MLHVELPIVAFLAAVLVLIPLPWHWRARNVATLSIVAWLFASNLIFGVNAIIWAGNVRVVAQAWCDIVTKVQVGATMALPACCLCLCIHLERIASVRHVQTTQAQRRRRMVFDALMCWGLPCIYMALHYIVQGHRYDIVENFGCRPAIYNSVQSVLIIWTLPLLVVTLTFIYAGMALVHFFRRRIAFAHHIQASNPALTTSRYFRLMAMAIVQMFWGVLIITINVWFSCRNGLRPWTNWEDVHFNFSRVGLFPTIIIPAFVLRWTYFIWWTIPISSVLFFSFFSFGEDAMKEYGTCFRWIVRVFSMKKILTTKSKSPSYTISPIPHLTLGITNKLATSDAKSGQDDLFSPDKVGTHLTSFDRTSSFITTPTTTTEASFATDNLYSSSVDSSTITSRPPQYSSRADDLA